jgi:hypothetical protein
MFARHGGGAEAFFGGDGDAAPEDPNGPQDKDKDKGTASAKRSWAGYDTAKWLWLQKHHKDRFKSQREWERISGLRTRLNDTGLGADLIAFAERHCLFLQDLSTLDPLQTAASWC